MKNITMLSILIIYWQFCNSMGQSTERHNLLTYERLPIHKGENELWECYDKRDYEMEYECRSKSKYLNTIPTDLGSNLTTLILAEADIKMINKKSLDSYRRTLKDVTLSNLPYLNEIEDGTFANIPNLRTIYITLCPKLQFAHGLLKDVTSVKFYTLRITQTGLIQIPQLSYIPRENVIHLLDLDRNKLEKLSTNAINVRAEQVTLNHNELEIVENFAFNGSEIGKLELATECPPDIRGRLLVDQAFSQVIVQEETDICVSAFLQISAAIRATATSTLLWLPSFDLLGNLRRNRRLTTLEPYAFKGMRSLRELDLSETSIDSLPAIGLDSVEILRIEETSSMRLIPSIYDLKNLKVARLTHAFHCCAFKYPEQHNPSRYAQVAEEHRRTCQQYKDLDTGQFIPKMTRIRKKRLAFKESLSVAGSFSPVNADRHGSDTNRWNLDAHVTHSNASDFFIPQKGKTIDYVEAKTVEIDDDFGVFHEESADISSSFSVNALCGNLSIITPVVKCYPEPNALNPCEDIMGYSWLRISVWFVVILTVVGNLAVIIVVIFSGGDITVTRFLICNLAIADLSMGLYLGLIAFMDLHSVGTYFNFAFDWQFGLGCKLAGFLTVFASHLSVFTLTVVTIERWFAITYAIYLTKRIHIGTAAKTMICGWLYSIALAALPLFGVSNYSSTSICLPMEVNRTVDKAYLYFMILINGVAFGLIVYCYARIYLSLGYETRRSSTKGEMTLAKKMALLIFTDFATFAPIAFFSLTALAGYPLIGVTRSKILLVFFYPLNSCANPFLYVIMTAQYRTDFVQLLAKCGFDIQKRHRDPISSNNQSQDTNSKCPFPLLTRVDLKEKDTNSSNNFNNDVYV